MTAREKKIRLSLTAGTVNEIFAGLLMRIARLGDLERSAVARGDHVVADDPARKAAMMIAAKNELEFALGEDGMKRIGRA